MKLATGLLLALVMTGCGSNGNSDVASTKTGDKENVATESEAVISDVVVEATNGGINPEHAAVEIKGKVYLASNSCFASGLEAKLVQRYVEEGNRIEVVAVIVATSAYNPTRICTMEFSPVSAVVETTVRYETESVEILNVNELGKTQNINDLM